MAYVEDKYGFTFHFSENNPIKFTEPFGCCGFWKYCEREKFCIIPKRYSNHVEFCGLAKREGYDNINSVKMKILKSKIKKVKVLKGVSR